MSSARNKFASNATGPMQARTLAPIPRPMENRVRFRSFAERYVIERAAHFDKATVSEDGWAAVTEAKTIYAQITAVSEGFGE